VSELRILLTGISFGEQPRWHDGRLWSSDWGPREVIAVDLDGDGFSAGDRAVIRRLSG
jgi:hypothetical protein